VKLRGRTTTPDRRRGRTLSPGARGAKQEASHGPLQRLLDVGEPEAADKPKKTNNAATKAMSDTKARRRGRAPIEGERADRRCR